MEYRTEIPMVVNQLSGMGSVMLMMERRMASRGHKFEVCTPEGFMMMKAKPEYTYSCLSADIEVPFIDAQGLQIMRMQYTPRAFHRQKMTVFVSGRLTATVVMTSAFKCVLYVYDAHGTPVFRVKRKGVLEMELQSLQKQKIGSIQTRWRGFGKEMFATKKYIDIRFPENLAVEFKAVVIAITVFKDILEENSKND